LHSNSPSLRLFPPIEGLAYPHMSGRNTKIFFSPAGFF
jgi:hypothetical protein